MSRMVRPGRLLAPWVRPNDPLQRHYERWTRIGLAASPADRPCAEAGLRLAHIAVGLPAPKRYVWVGSPMAGLRLAQETGVPFEVRLPPAPAHLLAGSHACASAARLHDEVRRAVWSMVGRHVLAAVAPTDISDGLSSHASTLSLGQHDAATLAVYSYLEHFGHNQQNDLVTGIELLASSAGWAWALEDGKLCVVSERASRMETDALGRLHCAHGPALRYPDGFSIHAWHGVSVPARAITDPSSISAHDIRRTRNVELRRVLIERMGYGRFLQTVGARKVQADAFGELYRAELPGDEPMLLLEVVNSTPEPDGHHRRYVLRVPPGAKTAREAVAWTFGLGRDDYVPEIET